MLLSALLLNQLGEPNLHCQSLIQYIMKIFFVTNHMDMSESKTPGISLIRCFSNWFNISFSTTYNEIQVLSQSELPALVLALIIKSSSVGSKNSDISIPARNVQCTFWALAVSTRDRAQMGGLWVYSSGCKILSVKGTEHSGGQPNGSISVISDRALCVLAVLFKNSPETLFCNFNTEREEGKDRFWSLSLRWIFSHFGDEDHEANSDWLL